MSNLKENEFSVLTIQNIEDNLINFMTRGMEKSYIASAKAGYDCFLVNPYDYGLENEEIGDQVLENLMSFFGEKGFYIFDDIDQEEWYGFVISTKPNPRDIKTYLPKTPISEKGTWLNDIEKLIKDVYGLDRNDWIDSVQDEDWMIWTADDWVSWWSRKLPLVKMERSLNKIIKPKK